MGDRFEINHGDVPIRFAVVDIETMRCFLGRQHIQVADAETTTDAGVEISASFGDLDEGEVSSYGDDFSEDCETLNIEEIEDGEVWFIASMFGIGRYAASWWALPSDGEHGEECKCRPMCLLEVLQDHAEGEERQGALEEHLGGLQEIWDHFWSGDALINGSSEHINGACSDCLVEGRGHLTDVLDEARNLAEELGEALAAFQSSISIGLDRYNL